MIKSFAFERFKLYMIDKNKYSMFFFFRAICHVFHMFRLCLPQDYSVCVPFEDMVNFKLCVNVCIETLTLQDTFSSLDKMFEVLINC